jgi:signal transduction histidine kinase
VRAAPRLGLGHLVVFVAVAVVLNAQFTWWVVMSLRENTERLNLARRMIEAEAERASLWLQLRVEQADRLVSQVPPGIIPAAQAPFVEIRVVSARPSLATGWVEEDGRPAFAWPLARGRTILAFLDPLAPHRWLEEVDPSLELVERTTPASGDLPRVDLPAPLQRLAIVPDTSQWNLEVARSRRRVVMVVLEGVFFVVAMITAVAMLWRVLRQEGARERQHENFVSAVTHELKTPIAGIRLALETVLSGRVSGADGDRFLSNALADSERLADLVEKVLEVTRYTGGAHKLRIEFGDLSQTVEEEVMAAERRASARGVDLASEITSGVQVAFDQEALRIVLSNLLENALKYAQGDPAWVRLTLGVEAGEAVLEVSDSGVGIEASELESIFGPFYRAGDEITRRTPGTGIGLFVAREIVVAHGGRLSAASAGRGQGSTFRLTLPGASVLPEGEFSEYDEDIETR